jgi:hypothetical protein
MTFAVLAEDKSDVSALQILVKRVSENPRLAVLGRGFSGSGNLRRKVCGHITDFARRGASRFIVCHDSDVRDPGKLKGEIEAIIRKGNCSSYEYSIVIPVQELESWILADERAIRSVISKLSIESVKHPESVTNPKEWLISKSRVLHSRPLYIPSIHNKEVVRHTDLEKLAEKCPSFVPLREFVRATHRPGR